jgi:histidinol-phosphate aminotransferase
LQEALEDLGLTVVPSEANFVMTVLPSEEDANRLFHELLAQGVVTRPLKAFGLSNCLRISTGSDEDNDFFVEALRKTYAANIGASRAD